MENNRQHYDEYIAQALAIRNRRIEHKKLTTRDLWRFFLWRGACGALVELCSWGRARPGAVETPARGPRCLGRCCFFELELELIISRWLWERGEKGGASLQQKQARVRALCSAM